MKLNGELSTSCWKLSQQTGWTIALDAGRVITIVHFNFHERSELTSILTSALTSETSVYLFKFRCPNGVIMSR
jgi:hypothetical protein